MQFGVVPRGDSPLALKLAGPMAFKGFGLSTKKRRQLAAIERRPKEQAGEAKRMLCFHRLTLQLSGLGVTLPGDPINPMSGLGILYAVARQHGFSLAEIRSPRRHRRLTACRHEAAYRIIMGTRLSYPQVGTLLHRDHTTILHSVRKHAERNNLPAERYLKGHAEG